MTWTWHDDDPATALSAQNMQNQVELRLRALEVAGGGGGGNLVPGAEVQRAGEAGVITAIATADEIVPADPTRATYVSARIVNNSGGPQTLVLESWLGSLTVGGGIANGDSNDASAIFGVGESYYFPDMPSGCTVTSLIEKAL